MSIARHHNEWLSLLEISGPFLSMPVLLRVFPQGLDALDRDMLSELRQAYEEWLDDQNSLRPNPAIHSVWVRYVLEHVLGFDKSNLLEGPAIPANLSTFVAEQGETLRPDLVIANSPRLSGEGPGVRSRVLIQIYPIAQGLEKTMPGRHWKASPAMCMLELLRATGVQLGLVTNGEQWMLVNAPRGETSAFVSWYAALWLEEPLTLRAFCSLLGASRFFSVADEDTLEGMLKASVNEQQEVTDQLGYQVRRAVEVLIRAVDKADQDRGRILLKNIGEAELYEAALTVMMRLVFLFSAEERGLLLLGDPLYDQNYAVSTLRAQLRETADQQGEEVLERRFDAWCRLLATFRAVHDGIHHDRLNLPAYGGSLFDPNRFPFLEGRSPELPSPDRGGVGGEIEPLPISNRTVLHLLEALQILRVKVPGGGPAEPRRLSFRALDVEQIGHVYEGLLDHVAVRTQEPVLGLTGTRDHEPEIPLSTLQAEEARGEKSFLAFLKEQTGRSENALKKAWQAEPDVFATQHLQIACNNDPLVFAQVVKYVGLIREDDFGYPTVFLPGSVYVTAGATRRATGTHYTPRSLTEPIVQHTLEPLVYIGPAEGLPKEQWKLRSPAELLELKVCDMAMGSAGFLVQVIRYLSERLVEAWESGEQTLTPQPPLPQGEGEKRKALPAALLQRVRELRQDATDAEALLWELLRNRQLQGAKFRRQHPFQGYILDFYCHEFKLAIELDGSIHADPEQMRRDAERTHALEEAGIKVIRFWNHQVLEQTESVLQNIAVCLQLPSPPGRGVGGEGYFLQITPEGKPAAGAPGETIIPRDDEERLVLARRLVADRCIYGVDKNPLAVEIAKLSIWLTTMDKGRPFTFLDHALKCGDSLVGASQDDFLRWAHGWQAAEATLFDAELQKQIEVSREKRRQLEAFTVKDVRDAEQKTQLLKEADAALERVKVGCDLLIGVRLLGLSQKDAEAMQLNLLFPYMQGKEQESAEARRALMAACQARVFHWEFEFPEVFERDGFSGFVGNPPFMGGMKISNLLGNYYLSWLKAKFSGGNRGDLCAYFFNQAYSFLSKHGFLGFIATNTIAEGDTRSIGLDVIVVKSGGKIYNATNSMPWPGQATLEVSIIHIAKSHWFARCNLNNLIVENISPTLDAVEDIRNPNLLHSNNEKSFVGANVGMARVIDVETANKLVAQNPKANEIIIPFLNGQELNSNPRQMPNRYAINFKNWPIEKAQLYPECLYTIREKLPPEGLTGRWWQFIRPGERMTEVIKDLERVIVVAQTSKTLGFVFLPTSYLFSHMLVVFAFSDAGHFAVLQSTLHEFWIRKYSSTLRTDIRYIPSDCFQTFPFPTTMQNLERIGETYHETRRQFMLTRQEGLTDTYKRIHNPKDRGGDISRLRELHVEMDNAVAVAYGWDDLDLGNGFHETPQGIRYTISEEARREVLARLLRLNHERYEEEVRQGLHDKKKPKAGKAKKAKSVREEPGQYELF